MVIKVKVDQLEVLVLAGGLGTRLRTVVADRPKALSIIAGKPFLHYVINYLLKNGAGHFIFSLGYLSEQVIDYVKDAHPAINADYSVEDSPLGTGGAIYKALTYSKEEHVLIVNADTYFDINLKAMMAQHLQTGADCTFALKHLYNFDRYGAVEMNEENRITSFKEKTFREQGLINGGYLLLKKSSFVHKNFPEVFSFEKDFIEPDFNKLNIFGFVSDGYFIDIGIPDDYVKAQTDFLNL